MTARQLTQSGAGMLDMFGTTKPSRTWLVQCPPGMLANGHQVKKFSSLEAFDGYVRQVRAEGYTVVFGSPFAATVEPRA